MRGIPEVAVVVATHNRADRLARLLAALEAQTLGSRRFEVIVVDDGSTDATPDVLAATASDSDLPLQSIRLSPNRGRAGAREAGWRSASAPLIAFTDDDCRPAPGWLEAGLTATAATPLTLIQGRTEPDPEELDALGPFSRTIWVTGYDAAFQTCNVFYPRALLELVGGFDTDAFGTVHGGEDSDLAWRVIEAGGRARFDPAPLVHHAVNDLGPLGKLRLSGAWSMLAYARHPALRRAHFATPVFWKKTHLWLAQAAISALLLPRWAWPLKAWFAVPWLRSLYARGKLEGGGPALAPFYAACDIAEATAAIRNSIRYRRLML